MSSKIFLKLAVIGMTAGLFLSAQSAMNTKIEKEVAAPKKEVVAIEKKEVAPEKEVTAVQKEVTLTNDPTTDKKEVAMMKCSKDPSCEGTKSAPIAKECTPKIPVQETCKSSDKTCGCGEKNCHCKDGDKASRKGAAREAVEG